MKTIKHVQTGALVLASLLVLGCQTSAEQEQQAANNQSLPDNAIYCESPRPEFCTQDYRPVCGFKSSDDTAIYSNACSACSNNEVIAYTGDECNGLIQ